jgi:signal peptidase I
MSDPHWVDPAPPSWGASASPSPGARALRLIVELAQTVLIAGLLFVGVNLITARIRVEGNSMEPSLHDAEFVVVNRLAYRWAEPRRGDIVVFRFPLDLQRRFIKRIIGLPGDTIQVEAGQVYVNGQLLEEPYIAAQPRYTGQWEVGEQEVFVLGDNRNNSSDSQNWGMLPVEDILGKAILVYWPPSDLGLIPHYEFTVAAQG